MYIAKTNSNSAEYRTDPQTGSHLHRIRGQMGRDTELQMEDSTWRVH